MGYKCKSSSSCRTRCCNDCSTSALFTSSSSSSSSCSCSSSSGCSCNSSSSSCCSSSSSCCSSSSSKCSDSCNKCSLDSSLCGSCSTSFCNSNSSCCWNESSCCSSSSSCCCNYPLDPELYVHDDKYMSWKRACGLLEFIEFMTYCKFVSHMVRTKQSANDVAKFNTWKLTQANIDKAQAKKDYDDWHGTISKEDYACWYNYMHFRLRQRRHCSVKCTQYALFKYITSYKSQYTYCIYRRFMMFLMLLRQVGAQLCRRRDLCCLFKKRAKATRCVNMKRQFCEWQSQEHGPEEFHLFLKYYCCDKKAVNQVFFINRVCVRSGCDSFANDCLYFYVKRYISFKLYKKYEKFLAWLAYADSNGYSWKNLKEYCSWKCTYSACIRKKNLKCWRKCFTQCDYNHLMGQFFCFLKITAKGCCC